MYKANSYFLLLFFRCHITIWLTIPVLSIINKMWCKTTIAYPMFHFYIPWKTRLSADTADLIITYEFLIELIEKFLSQLLSWQYLSFFSVLGQISRNDLRLKHHDTGSTLFTQCYALHTTLEHYLHYFKIYFTANNT